MKTLLLSLCMVPMCALHAENATPGDTIVVERPNKVTIISNDSTHQVFVEGSADNPTYHYATSIHTSNDSSYESATGDAAEKLFDFNFGPFRNKEKKPSEMEVVLNVAMGFNGAPGMPTEADARLFSSWEYWLLPATLYYHLPLSRHSIAIGVGLDWRNTRLKGDLRFAEDNRKVMLTPYDDDATPKYSQLNTFSLNFPVLYSYDWRRWGFSLGPVINLNLHGSIKTTYKIDGIKHEESFGKVRLTPVTVDWMLKVRNPIIDVYVKYSPAHMIKKDYGPQFHSVSFGLML